MKIELKYNRGLRSLAVGIVLLFLTVNVSGIISANQNPNVERMAYNNLNNIENDETITCQYRDMTLIKRKITASDIEIRKKIVCVRDTNVNYNTKIGDIGFGALPPTEEEWDDMVGQYEITQIISSMSQLPPSIDHSTNQFFPKINGQGGQPSCSAWAMIYYSLGYREAVNKQWFNASILTRSYGEVLYSRS
jgi:hypothetical protein